MLLVTREGAVIARTAAINQLQALAITAPDELRRRLRGRTATGLVTACLALRVRANEDVEERARRTALRRLARRIGDLNREIHTADRDLAALAEQHVPHLLNLRGVGVLVATQAWISWSAPGRLRNEACFAALAGTNPIPASSGKITRHRLNRFGDRALNRALHHAVVTLERCDPTTRAYVERRLSEGKPRPEIRRCLKRYLARKIYRTLETPTPALDRT